MYGGMGIMFENDDKIQRRLRDSLTDLHADGTVNGHYEVIINKLVNRS
jgi:hypothetical protein